MKCCRLPNLTNSNNPLHLYHMWKPTKDYLKKRAVRIRDEFEERRINGEKSKDIIKDLAEKYNIKSRHVYKHIEAANYLDKQNNNE